MLQGITVVDVKVTVGNATENHVHSGKVVGGGSKLLTIVVTVSYTHLDVYKRQTLGEIASLVTRTDPKSDAPIMMLSAGNGLSLIHI